MRKIIAALSFCCLLMLAGCQDNASIGIIGGADGPTSIIVASVPPAAGWIWALAAGVIAAAAVLITVIIRRKRK